MQWRRELFGAARARELADQLVGAVVENAGLGAVGGRDALEGLIRTSVVGAFTALPTDGLARSAPLVTLPRVPAELQDLGGAAVLAGLGLDVEIVAGAAKAYGVDGLGAVPVPVPQAPTDPAARDDAARAVLSEALRRRVDDLVTSALPRQDTLDRLIEDATARAQSGQPGGED
jgi:hypothetical protein